MFTRCPECETTFRLSAADLRRAKGRVRCGDCETVFNALEFLAEEPAESVRQSRDATHPDFARPTRLTDQANPVRDDDGIFDQEGSEAIAATADSRGMEAGEADDNGQDTPANDLAQVADRVPPSMGASPDSDDEYATDEQDGDTFDDDYGYEDDEYSNSGILVTDADFELPGDWHDRSIVDYAVAAETSVKAPPANEIWPDAPAGDDEDDAHQPTASRESVATESDAEHIAQSSAEDTGQNGEADTRDQTAREPVLFALPGYREDQEPAISDDELYGAGAAGERVPDSQACVETAEIAGTDDLDPGSLTQQLETALDAGSDLSSGDKAQFAETMDAPETDTSENEADVTTAGLAESAGEDTEATAEEPTVSFAVLEETQPAGDCDPLSDPSASRADFPDDDAEFESFDIWDDASEPAADDAAGPAADGRSESARVQHVATDADPFDDSMWERIPGVGSNEPVAAVIEDSLFARTGAGWDISQTLAGPTTELEQPGEPPRDNSGDPALDATVGQDDGDDVADEDTADDETDISLTGAADYSDSEGWQDESDSDLPGFRDEFEPIEATRADLLEFNAPEDTWSSIFTPAQLEDTSEDWLDEDEDEDPDTGWPALGSETEGNDLVEGLTSLPGEEEVASGQWAQAHDSAHSEPVFGAEDPLAEVTGTRPANDIEPQDVGTLQQDLDALEDEDEDEAGVESMPYSEDTGLPEGFAADDYEVQHIVLEDQNDIAGLTQTFQQTPTGRSEAPPWHAEKYEAEAEKPSRKGLWLISSVALIAALATQLIHYNRDGLATHPTWGSEVRRAYGALGVDVYPEWSVRSYEIRGSEAVAGESGADIMDIRAQIASIDNQPAGLPYLRVVLRDRWSNPIAAQHFSPTEYAAADKLPADGIMQPNQTLVAHVSIEDPGAGAQGFELELCIPRRDTGLECTGQPFK